MALPVLLSIAGSDSSGGAGIQADLKTFAAHRVYGAAVITALTAQNTTGVTGVHAPPPAFVTQQIDAVCSDLDVAAVKTGMLVDAAIIAAVVAGLKTAFSRRVFPVVVDPVLISKSGHQLLADDAIDTLRTQLLPLATLVTPNLPEAARLVGFDIVDDDSAVRAGRILIAAGAKAALIKGGHGEGNVVTDLLVTATEVVPFSSARVHTEHTHGTGCTLSSAIACNLALGNSLVDAVGAAIDYVHKAIVFAPGLGHGHGPLHHLHPFDPPVSSGDFQ